MKKKQIIATISAIAMASSLIAPTLITNAADKTNFTPHRYDITNDNTTSTKFFKSDGTEWDSTDGTDKLSYVETTILPTSELEYDTNDGSDGQKPLGYIESSDGSIAYCIDPDKDFIGTDDSKLPDGVTEADSYKKMDDPSTYGISEREERYLLATMFLGYPNQSADVLRAKYEEKLNTKLNNQSLIVGTQAAIYMAQKEVRGNMLTFCNEEDAERYWPGYAYSSTEVYGRQIPVYAKLDSKYDQTSDTLAFAQALAADAKNFANEYNNTLPDYLEFYASENDYQNIVTLKEKSEFAFSKVDKDQPSIELSGAKLEVGTYNIDIPGTVIDTWTSTNTKHRIKLVDGTYYYKELAAPDGYEASTEPIYFTVENGKIKNNTKLVIENEKKTTDTYVYISKQDITNNSELSGATLRLTKDNGIIDEWVSAETPHKLTNLADGEYTLTETIAPNGYETAESITFTVTNGSVEGGTVIMYDKPTDEPTPEPDEPVIYISKQDSTTGKELTGAYLEIWANDIESATKSNAATKSNETSLVSSWVSNGTQHEISLVDGEYTLVETKAPTGYKIADSITFTVENGKVNGGNKVVMKDVKKTSSGGSSSGGGGGSTSTTTTTKTVKTMVSLSKQSTTGSSELPGAELSLYRIEVDGTLTLVDEWTSTTTPHYIEGLTVGGYRWIEKTAPNDYQIAESMDFSLEADGMVKYMVMKDAPIIQVSTPMPKTGENTSDVPIFMMISAFSALGISLVLLKKKSNIGLDV